MATGACDWLALPHLKGRMLTQHRASLPCEQNPLLRPASSPSAALRPAARSCWLSIYFTAAATADPVRSGVSDAILTIVWRRANALLSRRSRSR